MSRNKYNKIFQQPNHNRIAGSFYTETKTKLQTAIGLNTIYVEKTIKKTYFKFRSKNNKAQCGPNITSGPPFPAQYTMYNTSFGDSLQHTDILHNTHSQAVIFSLHMQQ